MMRLLLTILAAIGFVWAYSSARADQATQPAAPVVSEAGESAAPGPRQFGAKSGETRIVVEAKEEAWVRVSDAQGSLVFMRTMKPGETYRVPDRAGLVLDTGNAKGLVLRVDGKAAPAAMGMVRRGIELNPDVLLHGAVARPVAPAEPAAAVSFEKAEKADGAPVAQSEPVQPIAAVEAAVAPAGVVEAPPVSAASEAPAHVAKGDAEPVNPAAVAAAQEQEPPVPSREALSAPPMAPEPKVETADATAKTDVAAEPEAASIAKRDETPAPALKPTPRQFAVNRRDARIVIEAKEAAWLRISDAEGKTVFMRNMQPGETYRVPNRPGLLLESGNAKGLALEVDGKPVPALSGIIRRGIELDPETLPTGAVVRRQAPAEKPAIVAEAKALGSEKAPEPATAAAAAPVAMQPAAEMQPAAKNNETPEVRETAPLLTATLPGPLPSAAKPAEPVVPAVAPVVVPLETATRAPVHKAAPAASVAPAAPRAKSDAVKPTALTAAPARVAPPEDRGSPLITGANAVTPSGVINATTSRIGLEVNKGTLVRLSQPASTVFVADPEVADIQMKSPGLVYILARRPGETALYAVDDRERVVLNTTLVVSHNVSRLRQALRAVAPDADVDAISLDTSLILTGTVQSAVEAENIRAVAARFVPDGSSLINQIRVLAPNQINLRVRIAEVSKETLKQFGINWESIARLGGNVLFGVGVGRDFITGSTFMREGTANSLFGSYRNGSQDINAAIDALATEGLITVLAEPNLTALSGETASFLAGGEFPIPIAQASNSNTPASITVDFKTFGVGLAFTPHLLDAGRINLRVRPEVSQLSAAGAVQLSGFTIPALTTRRAETTVELGSGQSFVIAGLLQNNSTQDISKVPLLGDLPVLGALFRSDRFRRNESELVIIVTPYVVRPISANRVAAPTDGFVAPSDVERILGGHTYRQQLPENGETPRTKDGQGLVGPTGFQLD
ncbi:MAG TPA: RodZ domain-containing protein [Alphaproteobacteria bacterium]|nr:RodZ domain-containing protein [Alphaproteobacteria bacterium]